MSEIEKATKQHQQIADMLREEKMLDAIGKMKLLAQDALDWNLKTELENMETTYRNMLQCLSQGMEDPERGDMYTSLVNNGLILNDRLLRSVFQQSSSILYHQTLRQTVKHSRLNNFHDAIEWMKQSIAALDKEEPETKRKHQEDLEIMLFNRLWTSDVWSYNEQEAVYSLINDGMPERMAALCVSAVTLAFIEMYDPQKYLFLLDIYLHESELVRQRAVVGIVLGCLEHDNRLKNDDEINFRMADMSEDHVFVRDVKMTQMHILQSCETERISKFMSEEFIPEMMKNPLLKNDKTGLDELATDEIFNPEWEKWIVSKNVKSKLNIMNELRDTGADIHMASFAHMKNFPFFRTISNWFLPFDVKHSAVTEVVEKMGGTNKAIFKLITNGSEFCDSDCYSFYLFLSSMPEATLKVISSNLPTVDPEMEDEFNEMIANRGADVEAINRNYIQSVYRFYKLFSRKHEFLDIFDDDANLQYYETMLPVVSSSEHIHDLAMFYFNNKHYPEAEQMYFELELETEPTAETAQKRGFCLQQMARYEEAIIQYNKADFMQPDNLWNLTHLAQCYQNNGIYSKAIECYLRAEELNPDNLNLLLQLGNCYAKQENYEEAFKRFFKVHYLDEKSIKVWRAIAWYSLMAGKMEQAEKFYAQIEQNEGENNVMDLLNIGHMHWMAHRYQLALEYYGKCYRLCGEESFQKMMMSDSDSLTWANVSPLDFPMIIDIVKENNENK